MKRIFQESKIELSETSFMDRISESYEDITTSIEEPSHFWTDLDTKKLMKKKKEEPKIGIAEARKEHESGFYGMDLGAVMGNSAKKYYRGDVEGVRTVFVRAFEEDEISELKENGDRMKLIENEAVRNVVKGVLQAMLFGEEKLV